MEFQSLVNYIRDIVLITRGSVESRSETISDRQVESWIHQYRALLIKQDIDKGKYPNPSYIQEIKGLKLSPVDASEIITKPIGKFVLKSNLQVPKTIDLNFSSGITYIGTADGREIQLTPQSRSFWQQFKFYTNNSPLAYLKNQYIYVTNRDVLEYIDIRGVFELPIEVALFNNPTTGGIPNFDIKSFKYPIPENMIPVLRDMIISKEIARMLSVPSDISNDAKNNDLNEATRAK
jgi:hypothetical protein